MYKYTILYKDGATDEIVSVSCESVERDYLFFGLEDNLYDRIVINRDTVKKITATDIEHCDGARAFVY